jgi:hypothetical protein
VDHPVKAIARQLLGWFVQPMQKEDLGAKTAQYQAVQRLMLLMQRRGEMDAGKKDRYEVFAGVAALIYKQAELLVEHGYGEDPADAISLAVASLEADFED